VQCRADITPWPSWPHARTNPPISALIAKRKAILLSTAFYLVEAWQGKLSRKLTTLNKLPLRDARIRAASALRVALLR